MGSVYTMRARQILSFIGLAILSLAILLAPSTQASPIQSKQIPINIDGDAVEYVKSPTKWCIRIVQNKQENTASVKVVGILTKNSCCNDNSGTQWGEQECHGSG